MSKTSCAMVVREKASAEANMSMDAMLLRRLACMQQPVLHLYDWEAPSITHGYFIEPDQVLSLNAISSLNVQLARRPTGGGVIVHTTDFAFSILLPANHSAFSRNTLENYAFINTIISDVVRKYISSSLTVNLLPCRNHSTEGPLPFCMADPTVYDVMVDGKKVAGGAQRRTKHGYLHQGSISLGIPPDSFLRQVLKEEAVGTLMKQNTYPLLGTEASLDDIQSVRKEISLQLQQTAKMLF